MVASSLIISRTDPILLLSCIKHYFTWWSRSGALNWRRQVTQKLCVNTLVVSNLYAAQIGAVIMGLTCIIEGLILNFC
jgi:hypothetical protein